MGHESIIYGYIEGSCGPADDYRRYQRANRAVIQSLPAQDAFPCLTASMFSIPGDDYCEGTYRAQVIHFGATMKSPECQWNVWLDKFEALLRRLYWDTARVHLEPDGTEISGRWTYKWISTSPPGEVVHSWEFRGGPRSPSDFERLGV